MSLLKVNEVTDLAGVIPDGVGRIVQIVRDTDTGRRTTTSTSATDVTGLSVSITPTSSTSKVILLVVLRAGAQHSGGDAAFANYSITDSGNTAISGAEQMTLAITAGGSSSAIMTTSLLMIAEDSPASTSAQTYKVRFWASSGDQNNVYGDIATSQIYAIEVAA